VALVATSLILGIVMQGALLARQREKTAGDTREAVILAGHLAAEARAAPYARQVRSGREGALNWELREEPVATDPRGRFVLSGITIAVAGARGQSLFHGETRALKTVPLQ
jgi:hypothetical protein